MQTLGRTPKSIKSTLLKNLMSGPTNGIMVREAGFQQFEYPPEA